MCSRFLGGYATSGVDQPRIASSVGSFPTLKVVFPYCKKLSVIYKSLYNACNHPMSELSLKKHGNVLIASPSIVPSILRSVWVRPQRGRKRNLSAGPNLDLLDPLYDVEGHWWEVVWALLQPDVGRYRPQAVRRTKTTPPPERGWYPTRSSCLVRCNTSPRVRALVS